MRARFLQTQAASTSAVARVAAIRTSGGLAKLEGPTVPESGGFFGDGESLSPCLWIACSIRARVRAVGFDFPDSQPNMLPALTPNLAASAFRLRPSPFRHALNLAPFPLP